MMIPHAIYNKIGVMKQDACGLFHKIQPNKSANFHKIQGNLFGEPIKTISQ
jgi:hypothetical protein